MDMNTKTKKKERNDLLNDFFAEKNQRAQERLLIIFQFAFDSLKLNKKIKDPEKQKLIERLYHELGVKSFMIKSNYLEKMKKRQRPNQLSDVCKVPTFATSY